MKKPLIPAIIITFVVTTLVAGSGFYFLQKNTAQTESTSSPTLTNEYLVSSEWGPYDGYGVYTEFHKDGTFDKFCACETGDARQSGHFEIQGNSVTLKIEKYDGLSYAEAKKSKSVGELPSTPTPDETLTLEKSASSLQFTDYLASNGHIAYWNRSSKIPEGSKREYETYILLTTQKNLKPKQNVKVRPDPYENSRGYTFDLDSCHPDCVNKKFYPLLEVYDGVVARTQFKDKVNGIEDYWYLAHIIVPMYSSAELYDRPVDVSFAWIHGSELELQPVTTKTQ